MGVELWTGHPIAGETEAITAKCSATTMDVIAGPMQTDWSALGLWW